MPTELLDADDEELITSYGTALEAVMGLWREFDRSLRSSAEVPTTWFEALLRLHRHAEPMPVGQLGEQLTLTSGGATRLVDRLESEGLVARSACPEDRRVQWVGITERGTGVLDRALAVHLADLRAEFGERTTPEDRATLVRILGSLRPTC